MQKNINKRQFFYDSFFIGIGGGGVIMRFGIYSE